jgi:GNAT superfamily N-acetyltransferase
VAEVSPAITPQLRAAMGPEGELVDLRLSRGCRAFVGCVADEVVAFAWLSTGAEWIGELGLEIRPPAGEAYVWNCVTLPAHRNRGYFRALLERVTMVARDEGISRLWIGAVDGGAESAVTGSGFVRVLYLRAVTLGAVRWIAVRPPDGVDQALLSAALSVLGDGRRPLRSSFRRVRHRRH